MKLPSARTLHRELDHLAVYFVAHPQQPKAAYFECKIAQVLSQILHLPFFTSSTDDPLTRFKVVWNGNLNPFRKAPGSDADCFAQCCGFNLVVEMTLRTGAQQWSQEGAQLTRHTNAVTLNRNWQPGDTYTLFVTQTIHPDTFFHLHTSPNNKIALFGIDSFLKSLRPSTLAFSVRNLEFKDLMGQLIDSLESCPDLQSYNQNVNLIISNWEKRILEAERTVYIGLKAYRAMKDIGRRFIGEGEVFRKLLKHPFVKQYLNIINQDLAPYVITESLLKEGLAVRKRICMDSILFRVPPEDFQKREQMILEKVLEME